MVQKNSQTHNFEIKNFKEVYDFCYLNQIMDLNSFIDKCFKQGFHIEKYGLLGKTLNEGEKDLKTDGIQEKWLEKEVIVEKRVEIPVEVIKEVEKIVEVPVEIIKEVVVEKEVIKEVPVEIIKEVPVEKIVTKIEYISDKTSETELIKKIEQLEDEKQIFSTKLSKYEEEKQIFSNKMDEMENNFQNEMSKKEKELDELRQTLDISRQTLVDDNKLKMLSETLQTLKKEIIGKDKQIDELTNKLNNLEVNINKGAVFMKASNINQNL